MTLRSWRRNRKGLAGARVELVLLQESRSMKSKYIRQKLWWWWCGDRMKAAQNSREGKK